jgi:hypothetical protein
MFSDSEIENYDDYKPKKEPHTLVDWLMLVASLILLCVAAYFWSKP